MLSGFLITTLLLEERQRTGRVSFPAFWRRRAYRLMPALAVLLAVYALVLAAQGELDGHAARGIAAGARHVTNLVYCVGGLNSIPTSLGPLWSLAQEEQFYLLWPPLLFIVLRGRVRLALVVLAAAAVFSIAQGLRLADGRAWFGPDARGLGIIAGCAVAHGLWLVPRLATVARPLMLPAFLIALMIVFFPITTPDAAYRGPLLVFVLCSVILVLVAYEGRGLFARALARAPFVWLGKISYSYLWHVPVFVALGWVAADASLTRRAWAMTAALAVAAASHVFVERPFLRRKRRQLAVSERQESTISPMLLEGGRAPVG